MASLNKVILAGNLTRDPELRYTPAGTAVADVGLAVSESFRNKAGETVEQTCFVDVVVWGRQAETTAEYLHKGSPALIEGRLQLDQWENNQGEKRSKLRVRADRVQFLGGPPKRSDDRFEDAPPPRAPAPAPAPETPSAPSTPPTPAGDDEDLPF